MGLAVKRYPFPEREWLRLSWASDRAREIWAPRFTAINRAWLSVERASVGPIRAAARQSIAPEQFGEFSRKAARQGLTVIGLEQTSASGTYQAAPTPLLPGGAWNFQVALTSTPAAARAFIAAWEASNDQVIGELLGFPPCCIEFFRRVWIEETWTDTTWPMTATDETDCTVPVFIPATAPVEANILLRWLGVRWVPHLPCSFHCAGTQALGSQLRALMYQSFPQEAAWIDELLNSPIEWSAWRGIAEIQLPFLKISTRTDATVQKLVVRRDGRRDPEASATGNVFPYRRVATAAAAVPLTFHRHPAPTVDPREWTDNGFSSREAMQTAHAAIVRFVHGEVGSPERALDLGCGNGLLVSQLTPHPVGVELDPQRAVSARGRCVVYESTIQDFIKDARFEGTLDLVLLMPGRLFEMSASDAVAVRQWLKAHATVVVAYAYGDWLERHANGLLGLCDKAGLPTTVTGERSDDVAVCLIDMAALS